MSGASQDDRPPMVVASEWASQILAIGLEMVLPAWLGHWLDQRWGTEPWLVAAGAAIGLTVALMHLLAMTKKKQPQQVSDPNDKGGVRRGE